MPSSHAFPEWGLNSERGVQLIKPLILVTISKKVIEKHFECSAIETLKNNKKVVVLCVYRSPPGNKYF